MPRKKVTSVDQALAGGEVVESPAKSIKPRKASSRSTSAAGSWKKASSTNPPAPHTNAEGSNHSIDTGVSVQEQVALLAYSFWEARGCSGGSPEEDWYRAEQEIRSRSAAAAGK